ncbi:MAG: hypothetical protein QOD74_399 [Variibacter sp.]|nr:hypothetical protein [Variibacter sp.]
MDPAIRAACPEFCVAIWNSYFSMSSTYLIYLAFGIASLVLFSSRMIGQPSYLSPEKKDPIGLFAPKYLTFRAKYRLASLSYCLMLVLSYVVLVFILDQEQIDIPGLKPASQPPIPVKVGDITYSVKRLEPTVPLLLAFVLIGVLPRIAIIETYEKRLRELIHEIFLIPDLGRSTANSIERAAINMPALANGGLSLKETKTGEEVVGEDGLNDFRRLHFLIAASERIVSDPKVGRYFDKDHIVSHEDRFIAAKNLAKKFRDGFKEAHTLNNERGRDSDGRKKTVALFADRLSGDSQSLHDEVRFLSLVLAGALLRQSVNREQIAKALAGIGLEPPVQELEAKAGDRAIFVALWVTIAYLLWITGKALATELASDTPGAFGRIFDQIVGSYVDAITSFIAYGFIVYLILRIQARKIAQGIWSADGDYGFGRPTSYLQLVVIGIALSAFTLFIYLAGLFSWLLPPAGGPNWATLVVQSLSQAPQIAVVALLVVFLDDRARVAPADYRLLWIWLVLFAALAFISGCVAGYVGSFLANEAAARDAKTAIQPFTAEQWREVVLSGVSSVWLLGAAALAVMSSVRYAAQDAFEKTLLRLKEGPKAEPVDSPT